MLVKTIEISNSIETLKNLLLENMCSFHQIFDEDKIPEIFLNCTPNTVFITGLAGYRLVQKL